MKIIGNAVGAPMPRTDYHQQDPTKSDYLVGREAIAQRVEEAVQAAQSAQSAASGTLPKTGGAMEGPIDMGGNALAGLPDPASDDEAASWGAVKEAVQAAESRMNAHAEKKDNPHDVTAAQTGAVEMKKLWENASYGSSFAAQTISLDLSGYDYVAIEYHPLGTMVTKTQFCRVGLTCHLDAASGNSDGGMGGANVYSIWRQAAVTVSGVAFTEAVYNKQNSTTVSITEKANYALPRAIYGIKGVT